MSEDIDELNKFLNETFGNCHHESLPDNDFICRHCGFEVDKFSNMEVEYENPLYIEDDEGLILKIKEWLIEKDKWVKFAVYLEKCCYDKFGESSDADKEKAQALNEATDSLAFATHFKKFMEDIT